MRMVRRHFTEYTQYIRDNFPRDKLLSAREIELYIGELRKKEELPVISYGSIRYHLQLLVTERRLYKKVHGIRNNKALYGWKD